MAESVGPTTPIELVEAVYAKFPRALGDGRRRLGRPLTFAEKVLFAHADDPATVGIERVGRLRRLPARSCRHAGRHRADGAAPVRDCRLAARAGADHRALRPPHPGAGRCRHRPPQRARRELRGVRVPAHGVGEVRHRLLEAGLRDHPPGRARAVRVPRRDDDRHRQPHAERRWSRDGRDRRRRCRRGRRHGGLALQHARPAAHRRAPARFTLGLGRLEGRDPQGRRHPHREGRHRRDRRVLRRRRRVHLRHGQGHDLQHGRGDRRDVLALRLRRAVRRVPEGHGTRGDRRSRRRAR